MKTNYPPKHLPSIKDNQNTCWSGSKINQREWMSMSSFLKIDIKITVIGEEIIIKTMTESKNIKEMVKK